MEEICVVMSTHYWCNLQLYMFDTLMWIKLIDVKPCGLYFEVDITVHVKLSGYALCNVMGYICHKHHLIIIHVLAK